eukprot:TRINITY_DN9509_c0_g1_i1.p1 TRINITY_DN9509_c0_g1~~TRINITY_DN9509_c0_g1_i1.p1  ORF type:complete len:224 (+),score=22.14 TRINITY_DN9509_c0_g1_i1:498-1169(+)
METTPAGVDGGVGGPTTAVTGVGAGGPVTAAYGGVGGPTTAAMNGGAGGPTTAMIDGNAGGTTTAADGGVGGRPTAAAAGAPLLAASILPGAPTEGTAVAPGVLASGPSVMMKGRGALRLQSMVTDTQDKALLATVIRYIMYLAPPVINKGLCTPLLFIPLLASIMAWMAGAVPGGYQVCIDGAVREVFKDAFLACLWLCGVFSVCERGLYLTHHKNPKFHKN